jgi:hypothetical protein
MSTEATQPSRLATRQMRAAETVEQFLARGGRIKRIEGYPGPEGRVLRRGQRADAGSRARNASGLAPGCSTHRA